MSKSVTHTAETAARSVNIVEVDNDGTAATNTRVKRLRAEVNLFVARDDGRSGRKEPVTIPTLTSALDDEIEFSAGDAAKFVSLLAKLEAMAIRLYET